jgi:hypothetical protein
MSANMTTLVEEKEDIIFPLLTTTPSQSTFVDLKQFKSATISFYNINYIIGNETIKNKQCFQWQTEIYPFWKPIPNKQILTDVSGIFKPGMNAILGILISIRSLFFSKFCFIRTYRLWKINST